MSMQQHIEQTLQQGLEPTWLSVTNESHMHRSSGPDAESHFKVVVVSALFDGERLLARHRRVNTLLAQALQSAGFAKWCACVGVAYLHPSRVAGTRSTGTRFTELCRAQIINKRQERAVCRGVNRVSVC